MPRSTRCACSTCPTGSTCCTLSIIPREKNRPPTYFITKRRQIPSPRNKKNALLIASAFFTVLCEARREARPHRKEFVRIWRVSKIAQDIDKPSFELGSPMIRLTREIIPKDFRDITPSTTCRHEVFKSPMITTRIIIAHPCFGGIQQRQLEKHIPSIHHDSVLGRIMRCAQVVDMMR